MWTPSPSDDGVQFPTTANRASVHSKETVMTITVEPGEQGNDQRPDRGVARRRPLDDVECPLTVREAARFLGVSPQTVYLWVERKQIPHLRVMGRNIRFLKSDLEPFRSRFKQEVEDGTTT
jgi:excisionase family DNA binding protein